MDNKTDADLADFFDVNDLAEHDINLEALIASTAFLIIDPQGQYCNPEMFVENHKIAKMHKPFARKQR